MVHSVLRDLATLWLQDWEVVDYSMVLLPLFGLEPDWYGWLRQVWFSSFLQHNPFNKLYLLLSLALGRLLLDSGYLQLFYNHSAKNKRKQIHRASLEIFYFRSVIEFKTERMVLLSSYFSRASAESYVNWKVPATV